MEKVGGCQGKRGEGEKGVHKRVCLKRFREVGGEPMRPKGRTRWSSKGGLKEARLLSDVNPGGLRVRHGSLKPTGHVAVLKGP